MPLVQANGVDIYCEVHGEGHPVLLVMGINAQLIHWPPEMIDRLVAAGFQVIAFDNRDMGQSTWFDGLQAPSLGSMIAHRVVNRSQQTPYTLSDMAEDGFGVLTALGIESAHIIGASMGGMIAQQMAILHPDRVRSLTSIMSHTGERRHFLSDPRALLALMGTTPANAEEAGERVVGLMKVIGSPEDRRPDDHYRWLGATAYERGSNPEGFKRQLAAIVVSGSRDAQLKHLTVPTAVIHGTVDPLVSPRGGRHTAAVIPGAELVLIDGMGHDLPVAKLDTILAAFRRAAGV
tara:strand:- start:622 stop:1494 length:873 start_codon:yes stop_codon:yes gene_type:complete